ncbi:hypothetical protein, variant 1 [Cryptococcus amylolentus CBS 6039]|uniref:Uncharacterized protein n=1 Tax=Cryptococcus amylolentus CBS 6039 TaxID=1295533 RepID=A0A1E3HQZ0_9TREE|nr:hypothetical protein, variant 1 [Cryptococcus amylolentus CBS 6039]ODN78732.1 hypothetical protein, variant 1 [Cryptococcus amylolentus CBS 6039]
MSAPISIANNTHRSPPSSASLSPQTPFFPTPALSSATPNQPGSLFKWASSFGKSPPPAQFASGSFTSREGIGKEMGTSIPEHDGEHSDNFEFGDFNDTGNSGSWVKGRRAMSMSMPYGAQSGVGAMLKNNGYSPHEQKETPFDADKNSKGQGVLRRLSIGGYRPPFISPPTQNTHLPPTELPASSSLPPPPASTPSGAEGPSEIKRSAALGGNTHARGRRFSESQGNRKKGVSPVSIPEYSASVM